MSKALSYHSPALTMEVLSRCSTTKARVGKLTLPHSVIDTPVFMPVGTQGTLKGLTTKQLEDLGIQIMLGNTYHLGNKPGEDILKKAGGLHKFMAWDRSLLTDSGGFQVCFCGSNCKCLVGNIFVCDHIKMVSLIDLAEFSEEGVNFIHPHEKTQMMLSPEKSIAIQNAIGADIVMQLDDVVSSTEVDPERFRLATARSIRWLDRCISAHARPSEQNIFPIIQGGLDEDLRKECLRDMTLRDVHGFAVGGLSGGECKDDFWRMVTISTDGLPENKPRYLMGVGYTVDLIVCSALGCDMFDCVYPTRTARFGSALVSSGQINLKNSEFSKDFSPIDEKCSCHTCRNYSRAHINVLFRNNNPSACIMLTVHNIAYQAALMSAIRCSISKDNFPSFIKSKFEQLFKDPSFYPNWACDALLSVGVNIK